MPNRYKSELERVTAEVIRTAQALRAANQGDDQDLVFAMACKLAYYERKVLRYVVQGSEHA